MYNCGTNPVGRIGIIRYNKNQQYLKQKTTVKLFNYNWKFIDMNEPVEVLGVLDPNGRSFYVLDLNSHMDSYNV